jgi:hemolysin D
VSELLVADIVAEEEEQLVSLVPKDTSVDLGFTDDTWLPDDVHTAPEVAEVIAKLPWWAVQSLLYIIVAFILVAFAWASLVRVDVVAVANGIVIPQGNIKPIQPASSGVVQNVFVKEGDRVGVGDALIQLDAAEMRTRLFKLRQEL